MAHLVEYGGADFFCTVFHEMVEWETTGSVDLVVRLAKEKSRCPQSTRLRRIRWREHMGQSG